MTRLKTNVYAKKIRTANAIGPKSDRSQQSFRNIIFVPNVQDPTKALRDPFTHFFPFGKSDFRFSVVIF